MALTHIDCFSGPGGICTGLHAAGFETKVAIEFIKSCVETYSYNHPEVHVIHSDIRDVTAEQILPYVPEEGIDLVTSGMPCETFSTAGNSSRAAYDDRQFLFREGIRIAQICNAKMILFENVPMITTKRVAKESKELIIDVLKRELEEAGLISPAAPPPAGPGSAAGTRPAGPACAGSPSCPGTGPPGRRTGPACGGSGRPRAPSG